MKSRMAFLITSDAVVPWSRHLFLNSRFSVGVTNAPIDVFLSSYPMVTLICITDIYRYLSIMIFLYRHAPFKYSTMFHSYGGIITAEHVIVPLDFKFDFSTTNLAVGANARVGNAAAYTLACENMSYSTPLTIPSEGFGEIAGLEIFPGVVGGVKEHADYVKLVIGGQSFDDQIFNELTAPGLSPGVPDSLGAAGLRLGQMPINLGLPLLLGGRPEDCAPKVPPGKPIEIEIGAAPTAEGGAALTQPWTVRVWMVKVQGINKLKEALRFQSAYTGQGYYDGNVMNCDFDLGDIAATEKMPLRSRMSGNPIRNPIPETGSFDPLEHWSKLPGGMDQDKPKMHVYSMFAKQMAATTTNEWYQFVLHSSKVQDKYAELYWDFTKRDALKITHIGFKNPAVGVIKNLWLKRTGREVPETYEVQWAKNPFPMPAFRSASAVSYCGPAKLAKPMLIWNEIGSIEMKDNGTSVAAWQDGIEDQAGVYVRGIRYEHNDREV